jgi:hypothetical protein
MSEKEIRKNYDQDLVNNYHEIIKKMYDRCKDFDNGETYYAKDIAGYLYLLCCDEGSQISILQQLGLKSRIRIYSTIPNIKKAKYISGSPLVSFTSFNNNGKLNFKFTSKTEDKSLLIQNKLIFNRWWSENIIFILEEKPLNLNDLNFKYKELIKRGEIIKFVRNQEGSGHFDKEINRKLSIIKENFMKIRTSNNVDGSANLTFTFNKSSAILKNETLNFEEYPLFIIRQIANEFLLSEKEIDINSARKFLHIT